MFGGRHCPKSDTTICDPHILNQFIHKPTHAANVANPRRAAREERLELSHGGPTFAVTEEVRSNTPECL